jgi:raffinose/stachyose/melibiose transport system permease protein
MTTSKQKRDVDEIRASAARMPVDVAGSQRQGRRQVWRGWREIIPAILGLIWLVISCYPIFYMLITSLRSQTGFFSESPWLPSPDSSLANYQNVLEKDFTLYFANSIFVTVISVLLIVGMAFFAAYAICRIRNRFTQITFGLFLQGLAIPLQATIIPIYVMITDMHLYDTLFALILPYVAFGLPLSVLVLVTYIRDIPKELHESMIIDGAGHFQILRNLVFPLSRPALITAIIYETIQVWNGFLFPLVLTQSSNVRVLPLALWTFQGEYTTDVPAVMAAVALSATPIILLYIFGRRQLLGGLIAGFSK